VKNLLIALMLLSALGVAGYSIYAYAFVTPGSTVHPAMKAAYAANPVRMYAHVFGSIVPLALGPLQFIPAIRRRQSLHRALGFVYFSTVVVGAVSGFAMALIAHGGFVSRLGFGVTAVLWLYTAGRALLAVKQRQFAEHEIWAIRNYAITFSAVTLRLYLGSFFAAGWDFNTFYPAMGWLPLVTNLVIAEWFIVGRRQAAGRGEPSVTPPGGLR
jgi:uncharacterized membrane protein